MSGLDFRVAQGELVSLLGPSGCGKTTLLRIIAGLTGADTGDVVLDGRNISSLPAHKRNISVVFQSYALFPHLSVAENVAFGLRARGVAKSDTGPSVTEALDLVRMSDFAERTVAALSGGQQQRVAVARALIVNPVLLLLDEPFSALDRKLRETMQVELKSLLRDRNMTAIFVTHDQEEAMGVSDRIAVMNAGQIEQFAACATIRIDHENLAVALLILLNAGANSLWNAIGIAVQIGGQADQVHMIPAPRFGHRKDLSRQRAAGNHQPARSVHMKSRALVAQRRIVRDHRRRTAVP